GPALSGIGGGGGLANQGAVMITDSTFEHNEARGGSGNTGGTGWSPAGNGGGGGITNTGVPTLSSTLVARNLTLRNNLAVGGAGNSSSTSAAVGEGGALLNPVGGTAALRTSTITDHHA